MIPYECQVLSQMKVIVGCTSDLGTCATSNMIQNIAVSIVEYQEVVLGWVNMCSAQSMLASLLF